MKKTILKPKSRRFILRHITSKDLNGYFESQQDKDAKKGFMRVPKNLKEAKKELQEKLNALKKKTGETFAIEINGEYVGYVEIHDLNQKYHEHKGIIGYCICKKFRGKGIATEAVKLVTDYAFKKYKLKRISGWCRTFNKASARVLEKARYKLEGIMRKNKFRDGKYLDDMIWAKLK